MGRIIHVEITAADHERAAEFYRNAFGWQTTAAPAPDGYLLAETGPGVGRLCYVRDTEGVLIGLRQT